MANPFAAFGMGALAQLAGNLSSAYGSGALAARKKREAESEHARYQMTPDMLARMEAIKAAGLHPLVGLGVSGTGSGSNVVGESYPIQPMNIREAEDPNIKRYNAARADLAELDVIAAQRRLAGQPGNQGGAVNTGAYTVKPAEITSVSRNVPFVQAGPPASTEMPFAVRNPVTGETQYGNLPGADVGEKIENMGEFWQAVLMTPMAGRFLWDAMVPDTTKATLFRFLDRLGETARARTAPERRGGASGSW